MKKFTFLMLYFLTIGFYPSTSLSQDAHVDEQSTLPMEFSEWVMKQESHLIKNGITAIDINFIKSRIFKRISKGMFVDDNTILLAIRLNSIIEYQKNIGAVKHPTTLVFIDSLLNTGIDNRPFLKINLLDKKAFYSTNVSTPSQEGYSSAKKAYQELAILTYSLNLKYDLLNLQANMNLSRILIYQEGRYHEGEEILKEIMQYPFYLIKETYFFDKMRSIYISAAKKRIQINWGNLAKLNDIFFIPSTYPELNPILQKYIEDAGGTWDR